MKRKSMLFFGLIILGLGCQKDHADAPGLAPEQITQKLSKDDDYQQLNNNAIRLAALAKKHEKVFKANADQLMAMKTDQEMEAFLNKNEMSEVVKIARDNQKISVALKERYPRINEVERIDLVKTAEISIKDKMEMGYYNPDGSYEYDGMYTDYTNDPNVGPLDKCWLVWRKEEDRCVRNFTVELVYVVVAAGFGGTPGLVVLGLNILTMNICKYDADVDFEECVEAARGK